MTEKNEEDKNKNENKKELEKKDNKKESSQEDLPIPAEVFETLPKEVQVSLKSMYSMQSFSGRAPSPLLEKLTPEHISSLIEGSMEENVRDYSLITSSRWFRLAYVLMGVGMFIFLTYFFGQSNESLYQDIIKMVVIFVGGFGVGLGFRSKKR